jgi:flagellar protein FliS
MSMNNPYNQYLENQLKTATPGKLLIMTYDAAIRFARTASEKMKEGKLDEQSTYIRKVQNILLELISSIDVKADTQLADNLHNLYAFKFDQLTHANIHDDHECIATSIDLLTEMRGVWAEAEMLVRTGKGNSAAQGALAA